MWVLKPAHLVSPQESLIPFSLFPPRADPKSFWKKPQGRGFILYVVSVFFPPYAVLMDGFKWFNFAKPSFFSRPKFICLILCAFLSRFFIWRVAERTQNKRFSSLMHVSLWVDGPFFVEFQALWFTELIYSYLRVDNRIPRDFVFFFLLLAARLREHPVVFVLCPGFLISASLQAEGVGPSQQLIESWPQFFFLSLDLRPGPSFRVTHKWPIFLFPIQHCSVHSIFSFILPPPLAAILNTNFPIAETKVYGELRCNLIELPWQFWGNITSSSIERWIQQKIAMHR